MVVMYAADELRQVGLSFSQRQRGHSQKFDQKIGGGQTADGRAPCPPADWRLIQVARQRHAAGTTEAVSFLKAVLWLADTGPDLRWDGGAGDGSGRRESNPHDQLGRRTAPGRCGR